MAVTTYPEKTGVCSTTFASIIVTGQAKFTKNGAGAPPMTFVGDLDTGIDSYGADEISVVLGGSQAGTFDASGLLVTANLAFKSGTSYKITFDHALASADRIVTFQDVAGTVYVTGGTDVAIADGGTGAGTATAAFDALSPVTTRGDIIIRDASNNVRLAIGAASYALISDGTDPAWGQISLTAGVTGTLPIANGGTNGTTATAAFDNLSPVTTRGDIVIRDVSNNVRLAIGAANRVLRSDGTDPSWAQVDLTSDVTGTLPAASGGTGNASYTIGDILYASGATALSALAGVATGSALISGGVGAAPSWGKVGLTTHISGTLAIGNGGTGQTTQTAAFDALSPVTTRGDIIIRDASNNVRLAVGAANTVLTSDGTDPSWSGAVTLATSLISPIVAGSASASGTLTIRSTTHATKGTVTVDSPFLQADGAVGAPSYSFSNYPTWGMYASSSGVRFSRAGTLVFSLDSGRAVVQDGYFAIGGGLDCRLYRDDANQLALRNATNAQSFAVYNTYTDASNYERVRLYHSGNNAYLETEHVGTGSARQFYVRGSAYLWLGTTTSAAMDFGINSNTIWRLNATGHLTPQAGTNTYNLGSTSLTVKTGYFGTSVIVPTVAGSESASGTLTIRSTTHGTKGTITLDSAAIVEGAYLSVGTDPASTGAVRLGNNVWVAARNFGNDGDINLISVNGSDQVALPVCGNQLGTATTWGIFGATPVSRVAAYTPTNVTPDRSFDADTVTVAELADVVGTMIADHQSYGLFQ